jgi:hypothetical protein
MTRPNLNKSNAIACFGYPQETPCRKWATFCANITAPGSSRDDDDNIPFCHDHFERAFAARVVLNSWSERLPETFALRYRAL